MAVAASRRLTVTNRTPVEQIEDRIEAEVGAALPALLLELAERRHARRPKEGCECTHCRARRYMPRRFHLSAYHQVRMSEHYFRLGSRAEWHVPAEQDWDYVKACVRDRVRRDCRAELAEIRAAPE